MGRTYRIAAAAGLVVAIALLAGAFRGGGHSTGFTSKFSAGEREAQPGASGAACRRGPGRRWEAYLSASRTYPANEIPPAVAAKAETAFEKLAAKDAKSGDPGAKGHKWKLYGPTQDATQPGVMSFSGATNSTASRVTALVVSPDCTSAQCRVWVGVSGGGVWRTDDATAADPDWKQLKPDQLDQNSVGTLTLDPTDKKGNTIYLGTGEANRCGSGCEAGVGIYKSTNGGEQWTKIAGACVSNATYPCVVPGNDAFLGRGINSIVIDPRNANHILVGSTQAVRGLSHVIGNGGGTRLEPGANAPGVYESADGGQTFTEVWNGNSATSFGITDLELDPLNQDVVYASAFDAGVWRRDAGAASTALQQVFAPQFATGAGTDRTMFALTVKNGKTRIYLTDGTANGGGIAAAIASNFWRTDNANQPAATLLASQAAGSTPPNAATHTFPANYNAGWQLLTSKTTATHTSPRTTSAGRSAGTTRRSTRPPGCPTPST